MAKLRKKKRDVQQDAIIKVYNELQRKFVDVIIPSGITVGLEGDSDFERGIKMNGPLEFKTTTAPENTDMKMYAVGSSLYFNGSAVGGSQDLFKTFAVSGQSDVVADSPTDTMTLVAGSNMTITTDAGTDSITFASSGGGGSGGGADDVGWTGPSAGVISTTGSLGIGTTSPAYILDVSSDTDSTAISSVTQYDDTSTDGPNFYLRRARGTASSPTVVSDGDSLGAIDFWGHDGTNFEHAARIVVEVDGSPAGDTTDMPGRLIFKTTADGSDATSERMRINNTGSIGINTSAPGMSKLHVYNNATIGGIGSLNLDNAGLRVQDSSYNMFVDGNTINIDGPAHIDVMTNDYFKIATNDTARVTVLGGGNVGIGTSSPAHVLSVVGAVSASLGLSGSLTRLVDGSSYLAAGAGISIASSSNGQIIITNDGTVGDITAVTAGTGLLGGGSSGDVTLAINDSVVATLSGSQFSGVVGITGSLGVVSSDGALTTFDVNNTGGGDPQMSLSVAGTEKCTWSIDNDDSDKFKLGNPAGTVLTVDFDYGYAGFGTETPDEALEVETGAAGQTTTTIQVSNSAANGDPQLAFALSGTKKFTMGVDDSDSDKFKIGTTACSTNTMLTLDADGNVGIGTTTPEAYLDIKNVVDDGQTNRTMLRLHNYRTDDADVNDFAPTSIDFVVENVSGGAKSATSRISSVQAPIGTDHTIPAGEKSSALIFSTMNNETLAEAVRINNLGYVGIGTAAPSGSLDVKGDGSTSQVFLLSGSGAKLSSDESSYTDTNFFVSGSIDSRGSSIKGAAVFGGDLVVSGTLSVNRSDAGGYSMVTVTTDGKVGIGTDTPGNKLSVGGNMDLGEYLYHKNDQDTFIRFQSDDIDIQAGGVDLIKMSEDGADTQVLILSGGAATSTNEASYTDANFFVSGSTGSKDTSTRGTAVFGGDAVVSGSLHGGSMLPLGDNLYNLGSESRRFANIYTGDLHLRNERGNWTIVEEEDYLCVFNNKNGKKYKMMLEPMDDE